MEKLKLFFVHFAISLLAASLVSLFVIAMFWCFCSQEAFNNYGTFVGGTIGCLVAIANAILLYATLKTQQEDLVNSKKKAEREHFENTFFRMIDYFKVLTNNLYIQSKELDRTADCIKDETIQGVNLFVFAILELDKLKQNAIAKKNIYHKFSEDGLMQKLGDDIKNMGMHEHDNLCNSYILYWMNTKYDIDEETWNKMRNMNESELENECYRLFWRRWYFAYEHYIRYVYTIMQYVIKYAPTGVDQAQYFNVFSAQLTRKEGIIIKRHAQFDNDFANLLEQVNKIQNNYKSTN